MSLSFLRAGGFVFVDTSAYFASLVRRDQNHDRAQAIQSAIVQGRGRMLTTNFVLAETHAMLLRELGGLIATRHLFAIDTGSTVTIRVGEEDEREARSLLAMYDDKDFSLTDATSFAIMDRLGNRAEFTFDHHFAQYGLQVLTAE